MRGASSNDVEIIGGQGRIRTPNSGKKPFRRDLKQTTNRRKPSILTL